MIKIHNCGGNVNGMLRSSWKFFLLKNVVSYYFPLQEQNSYLTSKLRPLYCNHQCPIWLQSNLKESLSLQSVRNGVPECDGMRSRTRAPVSIQEKFRFEISEIPRAQCNGTFRLHRPDTSHCASGYCSCKQDTKERYWEQQFCQMERDISVRPTEMTRPVTVDHLQSWSRIFRSDQTEIVRSIWCTYRNFRNFGLNRKRPKSLTEK